MYLRYGNNNVETWYGAPLKTLEEGEDVIDFLGTQQARYCLQRDRLSGHSAMNLMYCTYLPRDLALQSHVLSNALRDLT